MSTIQHYQLQGNFFVLPGWFFLWKPFLVPYKELNRKAEQEGITIKSDWIIEDPTLLGMGWFGAQIEDGAMQQNDHIKKLDIDCELVEIDDQKENINDIIKSLMRQRPLATNFLKQRVLDPLAQSTSAHSRVLFW